MGKQISCVDEPVIVIIDSVAARNASTLAQKYRAVAFFVEAHQHCLADAGCRRTQIPRGAEHLFDDFVVKAVCDSEVRDLLSLSDDHARGLCC